jgi:mannose-6-phosphate isomerase class I
MNLKGLPAGSIEWSQIPESVHQGKSGTAAIRSQLFGDIQIRHVVYSSDYVSDHWCSKGHIVFVIEGQLVIEYQDGVASTLSPGTSYLIADNDRPPHRGVSKDGATVFIVD